MNFISTILCCVLISNSIATNFEIANFLVDFFQDKDATIIANICWSFEVIKEFSIKLFTTDKLKTIVFNSNFNSTSFLQDAYLNTFRVLDISCPNAINLLSQANKLKLFRAPNKWILIKSGLFAGNSLKMKDDYITILEQFNVLIDSEVFGANTLGDIIKIYQYYKINPNATLIRENYGEWTKNKGLSIQRTNNITSYRRKNFQHETIRLTIVILNNDTLNHLEDFRYPVVDMISKASFCIILNLIDYLKASYSLLPTLNWGYKTKTGKMIGMAGFLMEDRADLTVSGMVFIKERAEVIDFVKMIVPTGIVFFFRKPPLSYVQNIFTLPFRWSLWLSMIILVLLVMLLLYISVVWENRHQKKKGERAIVFGDIVIIALSAICLQGVTVEPRSLHGRTITFLLFTALMFLYTAYSANIVALLQSTSDIVTLEDLLNSRLTCGAEDIVYNRYFLENAKEPIRRALYREKIGSSGFYNATEGLMKMKKGLFSFLMEKGPGYYYILQLLDESEKCELQAIEGYIEASDTWIAVQQKSPYKEIFKIGLFKTGEYGLQKRILNRFYKKTQCSQSASSFTSVGLIDFYPALIVYISGLFLAITIFIIEKLVKKYRK